jgi:hypothetical protein
MLIGHFAPALVLQRTRPLVPLWVLFLATQAVDVLWGIFILTGVAHARIVHGFSESNSLDLYDMPYSHSLVATAVWAVVFASLWRALRPRRRGEALLVGLAVASHFVLDLVVLPVPTYQDRRLPSLTRSQHSEPQRQGRAMLAASGERSWKCSQRWTSRLSLEVPVRKREHALRSSALTFLTGSDLATPEDSMVRRVAEDAQLCPTLAQEVA